MKLGIISTVTGDYTWAGSEEAWFLTGKAALAQGHDLSINMAERFSAAPQISTLLGLGATVFPRPELTRLKRFAATRGHYSRFSTFLRKGYDMLLISMGGIADCVWIPDLFRECMRYEGPTVVLIQANCEDIVQREHDRALLREFYEKAKHVFFVSDNNRTLAKRQLAFPFNRSHVVTNPLREPIQAPLAWPVTGTEVSLAQVARFEVTDKRQDQLLEALSSPTWRDRAWSLTFFGSGPDESHIRRLIQFYELQDKVKIGGFVNSFQEIWRTHHLHILPSAREGMPLALLESMACGRPAVVSRAGGNAELIEDGEQGFVSPGIHAEILALTLERAWAARGRWSDMGTAAFAKVTRLVSPDWGDEMLRLLRTVVN
jgi:glycosyltransferase involved in cell wall biosynthesis